MTPGPSSAPDPGAYETQMGDGAHHRRLLQEANAVLAASPARALLDCAQTIHRTLLASDPKALRRSVGWWGRLLARDIALQEESKTLRSQLGVHVLQARRQLQALTESDQKLQALDSTLRGAIDELIRRADALSTQDSADAGRRRLQLATLATSLQTTASHLALTMINHRELGQRVRQMLPQVELLLDQRRMLLAGLSEQHALQSATRSMNALQGLEPPSLPASTFGLAAPDETASKRTPS